MPDRVLVVDDNAEIHRDFVRILAPTLPVSLDALEAGLFGAAELAPTRNYVLGHATSGLEAIDLVRKGCERNEPFAMTFVDARMPPGIDGVETIHHMWEIDDALHVVLCSAYADYSWEDLSRSIGTTDRFLVLRKPFDPLEVRQLAAAFTHKARLARAHAQHVEELDRTVRERTRELEQALESLSAESVRRAEAERTTALAQRMQALGQLTAGIAHEINNPLLVCRGNLEMLHDDLDHRGLDDLLRPVRLAIASADRIARIVKDVRLFSNPRDLPKEPVDVARALEASFALLGSALTPNITVVRRLDAVPAILASTTRLEQVFVNVLDNAIKAFPADLGRGAAITITVVRVDAEFVAVEIEDNGDGIRDAHLAKVFEPFFTTRGVGRGSGLGLAISKSIVDSFGGTIEIRSQCQVGTTVRIVLPIAPESAPEPPPPEVSAPTESTSLEVLVVDDEPMMLTTVRALLRRHRVTTCDSAEQALQLLGEKHFDVIVCDVTMPGMGGPGLVAELRRTSPDIAETIVLMTGAVLGDEIGSLRESMNGRWLGKPFTRRELQRALDDVVQRTKARER